MKLLSTYKEGKRLDRKYHKETTRMAVWDMLDWINKYYRPRQIKVKKEEGVLCSIVLEAGWLL